MLCGGVVLSQASDTAAGLVIHYESFAEIANEIGSVAIVGKTAHHPSIEFHSWLGAACHRIVTIYLVAGCKPVFALAVTIDFLGADRTGRAADDVALVVEMIDALSINGTVDGAVGSIDN